MTAPPDTILDAFIKESEGGRWITQRPVDWALSRGYKPNRVQQNISRMVADGRMQVQRDQTNKKGLITAFRMNPDLSAELLRNPSRLPGWEDLPPSYIGKKSDRNGRRKRRAAQHTEAAAEPASTETAPEPAPPAQPDDSAREARRKELARREDEVEQLVLPETPLLDAYKDAKKIAEQLRAIQENIETSPDAKYLTVEFAFTEDAMAEEALAWMSIARRLLWSRGVDDGL